MNKDGVRFVHDRTRPLAIDSMEKAQEAIAKALVQRAERQLAGKELETDADEPFALHLAWLIGFDTLTDERRAIHDFTAKVVD